MESKKLLSGFVFLFGEFLIVIAFLYLGKALPGEILALNIAATTLIYSLYASQLVFPQFKTNDKAQRWVGSLGIKGYFYLLYSVAAVVAMVTMNGTVRVDTATQFIVHGILVFILLLGVYFSMHAGDKVEQVYYEQGNQRYSLDALRKKVAGLNSKISRQQNLPKDITERLSSFNNGLRYVSPSNTPEAVDLENQMANEIEKLDNWLFTSPPNHAEAMQALQNCEVIYRDRTQVYSN